MEVIGGNETHHKNKWLDGPWKFDFDHPKPWMKIGLSSTIEPELIKINQDLTAPKNVCIWQHENIYQVQQGTASQIWYQVHKR